MDVTTEFTVAENETDKPAPEPEPYINPFIDVKESDWFYDNVTFAYTRGLFSGTSTNPMMFSPGAPMTRAMFAAVLARLDGADLSGYTASRFGDVAPGQWYAAAVEWAADNGIVSGGGNFDPGAHYP